MKTIFSEMRKIEFLFWIPHTEFQAFFKYKITKFDLFYYCFAPYVSQCPECKSKCKSSSRTGLAM